MTESTVFECGICLNFYNEISHRPLSLPCGHVYCERCLSKHSKNQEIICPIDSIIHKTSVRNLPCCFAILANLPRALAKELCCSRHPRKKVKFRCVSHSVFLCSECIIQHTGNGHEIQTFNPSSISMKSELHGLDDSFRKKTKELADVNRKIDVQNSQLESYYRNQLGKIKKSYDEIIENLLKKKKEMTQTITKHFHEQKKTIELYKFHISRLMETLIEGENTTTMMTENFGKYTCEEFYAFLDTIKSKLSRCESISLPELQYYSFHNSLCISSFGSVLKNASEMNKCFTFEDNKAKTFVPKLDISGSLQAVSPRNLYSPVVNIPQTQRSPETLPSNELKFTKHCSNRGRIPSQPPKKGHDRKWRKRSNSL